MVPPRASISLVVRSHCERTCASDPEATMRSPTTATAVTRSRGGNTWPFTTASEARSTAAFCVNATIAPESMKLETDVAHASTLPSTVYLDPAVLEREKDRIFYRTWQLVAHMSELARVGDFKPATILDEPILLTHAQDRKLPAFYTLCAHLAPQACTT